MTPGMTPLASQIHQDGIDSDNLKVSHIRSQRKSNEIN